MVAIKGNVSVAEVPQAPYTPTLPIANNIQMQLVQQDVVTHCDTPLPIEKAQTVEIKDEVVTAEATLPQASASRIPLDEIQMLLVQQ